MTNPATLFLPLRTNLSGRTALGEVLASASGPVRFGANGLEVWEPTTNYVLNPRFEDVIAQPTWNWDVSLNGPKQGARSWGLYNGGVPNPETGYHAQTALGNGPNGENTLYLPRLNSTVGVTASRYLAGNIPLYGLVAPAITTGSQITVSFDMKAELAGLLVTCGIYHRSIASGSFTFTGSTSNFYATTADQWERRTATWTVDADWNTAVVPTLYLYGQNGSDGRKWVTNVQVEVKPHATPCAAGSMGTGFAWSGTAYASASTRAATTLTIDPRGYIGLAAGELWLRVAYGASTDASNVQYALYHFQGGNRLYVERLISSHKLAIGFGSGGGLVSSPAGAAHVDGTPVRSGLSWSGTTVEHLRDGAVLGVTVPASGLMELGPSLSLGGVSGFSAVNGPIADLMIFRRKLTPEERAVLQAAETWSFDLLDDGSGDLAPLLTEDRFVPLPVSPAGALLALPSGPAGALSGIGGPDGPLI